MLQFELVANADRDVTGTDGKQVKIRQTQVVGAGKTSIPISFERLQLLLRNGFVEIREVVAKPAATEKSGAK